MQRLYCFPKFNTKIQSCVCNEFYYYLVIFVIVYVIVNVCLFCSNIPQVPSSRQLKHVVSWSLYSRLSSSVLPLIMYTIIVAYCSK